jgi:hypothetical protein
MAELGTGSIEPAEGMAALEALMRAPMRQMAFAKTDQPRAPETTLRQVRALASQASIRVALAQLSRQVLGQLQEQLEDRGDHARI